MSDFFTRLAERTLGLALIIQPIKPSLFAPEMDPGAETLLEIDEETEAAQAFSYTLLPAERPKQTPAAVLPTARTEHVQAEQPLPVATPNQQLPDALPVKSMNGARSRHAPALSERADVQRRESTTKPHSSQAAQGLTTVIQEIDATTQPSGRHASMASSSQTSHETPKTGASFALTRQERNNDAAKSSALSEGAADFDGSAGFDSANALERRMETSISLQGQPVARQAILGERNRRGSQLPAEMGAINRPLRWGSEEAAPEPAIQVTIGRVEVRAVTVPAPAARQPEQVGRPSAMGLDEYLRRQEQGGRR